MKLVVNDRDREFEAIVRCEGERGIEGEFAPVPVRIGARGIAEIVEGLEVDDFAQGKIDATVNELKEERDAVRKLELV